MRLVFSILLLDTYLLAMVCSKILELVLVYIVVVLVLQFSCIVVVGASCMLVACIEEAWQRDSSCIEVEVAYKLVACIQFSFALVLCKHPSSFLGPYRLAALVAGVDKLVVSLEPQASFLLSMSVSLMNNQASYKQLEFSFLVEHIQDLVDQDTLVLELVVP